jgi:glycosyltransferase involved in cell wall biosynthesis
MLDSDPVGGGIGVLVVLEGATINGVSKPVLEFVRQAAKRITGERPLDITLAVFNRHCPHPDNSFTRAAQDCGVSIQIIHENHVLDFGVMRQLQDLVHRSNPEIIWTNSVKSHFLTRLAGLHKGRRWIAFHHGYTTTDLKMRFYNQLDRWSIRGADRVLTVCKTFAEDMERRGVRQERIAVQSLPVRPFPVEAGTTRASDRDRLDIREHQRVLLCVGRLSKEKGHADLISAVARLLERGLNPPIRLLLVGEGPERPRLERLCRAQLPENVVTLAGYQEDVRPYFSAADVFVLPSHSEGTPNVLLEAMAMGVPVVATSVGGVPDIAVAGHNALLVSPGDPEGLSDAIAHLLSDTQLGIRLASSARTVVERHQPSSYFDALRRNLLND